MGCRQSKKEETTAEEGGAEGQKGEGAAAADASPKLIVVFGATGLQGGSVLRALKADDNFKVRGVTRNLESDKAKALQEEGFELVAADLDDAESLKAALEGAYGVFGVTNYYEHQDGEKETTQGKTLVDVCKEKGISHLVFSGLESVKDEMDKACQHFDAKAEVEKYIKEQEVPHTIVRLAAYYENLLHILKPKKNDSDEYVMNIPMGDKPFSMICVSEFGECVHQILANPDDYKTQTLGLASDTKKVEEYAAVLTKALDKKFIATEMTAEVFGQQEFPAAADLGVMFEYYQTEKCVRDVDLTRKLNPDIPTFEQWVENHKDALLNVLE